MLERGRWSPGCLIQNVQGGKLSSVPGYRCALSYQSWTLATRSYCTYFIVIKLVTGLYQHLTIWWYHLCHVLCKQHRNTFLPFWQVKMPTIARYRLVRLLVSRHLLLFFSLWKIVTPLLWKLLCDYMYTVVDKWLPTFFYLARISPEAHFQTGERFQDLMVISPKKEWNPFPISSMFWLAELVLQINLTSFFLVTL